MNYQEEYNDFCKKTDIKYQDKLSGGYPREGEKRIISDIKPKTLLDIGCGSGHRMFPYYEQNKIKYLGIEKFNEIIDQSSYKNKILCLDICDQNFLIDYNNKNKENLTFDLIVLFGVINGFIDEKYRKQAWENLSSIFKNVKYLVVNTLSHFDWFTKDDCGKIIKLHQILPPQYFYSEMELQRIFKSYNFEIFNSFENDYEEIKIKFYVLKIK